MNKGGRVIDLDNFHYAICSDCGDGQGWKKYDWTRRVFVCRDGCSEGVSAKSEAKRTAESRP